MKVVYSGEISTPTVAVVSESHEQNNVTEHIGDKKDEAEIEVNEVILTRGV